MRSALYDLPSPPYDPCWDVTTPYDDPDDLPIKAVVITIDDIKEIKAALTPNRWRYLNEVLKNDGGFCSLEEALLAHEWRIAREKAAYETAMEETRKLQKQQAKKQKKPKTPKLTDIIGP